MKRLAGTYGIGAETHTSRVSPRGAMFSLPWKLSTRQLPEQCGAAGSWARSRRGFWPLYLPVPLYGYPADRARAWKSARRHLLAVV